MSDFQQEERQPTEQELREYLEQLRGADPVEFLAQAFNIMATGAQAKLGLADARLLIDGMGALVEAVAAGVPDEVATPMRNGVAQLKTAQVQAEKELAAQASQQASDGAPGPGAGEAQPGAGGDLGGQPGGQEKMTDRLWVPGRGPQG